MRTTTPMKKLINAAWFQIGWWACIIGASHGQEVAALVLCSVLVCLHLVYTDHMRQDIQLALIVLLIGIVTDSAFQCFSIISFYGWSIGPLSPFWLWMLWLMFALTLRSSLAFLHSRLALSALLGLLFGPLTYLSGAKLGAAALDASHIHIALIALTWMVVLPATVLLSQKISPTHKGCP
jgi:Protein of unknown function (DUF2878)